VLRLTIYFLKALKLFAARSSKQQGNIIIGDNFLGSRSKIQKNFRKRFQIPVQS
jgi:hypothetical protein